jgi:N6-L-threonylcarbamoyladenine synthase
VKVALGIETSCDDTSVALVKENGQVLVQLMASQVTGHLPFGGVVPEVASRMHSEALLPLIDQAIHTLPSGFSEVDLIAVSSRPGLIGSLLVGVITAKTLSLGLQKPLIGVNHIHGHIFSPFLSDASSQSLSFNFPYLSLVVSGGHTHLYLVNGFTSVKLLGKTRDDAAGEAFDKFSNLLRLGFPGGPIVDQKAQGGDPHSYAFPKAMLNREGYEFSFSGLKASAARLIESLPKPFSEKIVSDLCASFQEAICEVLIHQLNKAKDDFGVQYVSISGGVSANSRLRSLSENWAKKENIHLLIPPMKYCTDNASMIAFTGLKQFEAGWRSDQTLTPSSSAAPQDYL